MESFAEFFRGAAAKSQACPPPAAAMVATHLRPQILDEIPSDKGRVCPSECGAERSLRSATCNANPSMSPRLPKSRRQFIFSIVDDHFTGCWTREMPKRRHRILGKSARDRLTVRDDCWSDSLTANVQAIITSGPREGASTRRISNNHRSQAPWRLAFATMTAGARSFISKVTPNSY